MKSIYFLIVFLLFFVFYSYSQEYAAKDTVIKDERIEWLLEQHKLINASKGVPGFRVQIYADLGTRSKQRTEEVQEEFDELYPEVGSYLIYEEPYFKLRVGNFRTRLDAKRFLESISSDFEYAFIVPDEIEFPGFD